MIIKQLALVRFPCPVHELYYHAVSKQLFVGNYKEGILIYDIGGEQEKSSLVNSPIM